MNLFLETGGEVRCEQIQTGNKTEPPPCHDCADKSVSVNVVLIREEGFFCYNNIWNNILGVNFVLISVLFKLIVISVLPV